MLAGMKWVDNYLKTANILNYFFFNTSTNLGITYNKSLSQNRNIPEITKYASKSFGNYSSAVTRNDNKYRYQILVEACHYRIKSNKKITN